VKSELKQVYKKWEDKDVAYIITEEEKQAQINLVRISTRSPFSRPSVKTDSTESDG
jgi:hypothetical protein